MHRRALLITALGMVALTAGGCGKRIANALVELQASSELNPDVTGRASPLRVRLYELKAVGTFNSADFFSLYERDKSVLASDLVAMDEIQVEPGMQKSLKRTLGPDTKFLAVLAPYRDLDNATWRASLAVPPGKTVPVVIALEPTAVSLSLKKK